MEESKRLFLTKYYNRDAKVVPYNSFIESQKSQIQHETLQSIDLSTFKKRGFTLNEQELLNSFEKRKNNEKQMTFSVSYSNETIHFMESLNSNNLNSLNELNENENESYKQIIQMNDLSDEEIIPPWKKSTDSCDTIDLDALLEDEDDDNVIVMKVSQERYELITDEIAYEYGKTIQSNDILKSRHFLYQVENETEDIIPEKVEFSITIENDVLNDIQQTIERERKIKKNREKEYFYFDITNDDSSEFEQLLNDNKMKNKDIEYTFNVEFIKNKMNDSNNHQLLFSSHHEFNKSSQKNELEKMMDNFNENQIEYSIQYVNEDNIYQIIYEREKQLQALNNELMNFKNRKENKQNDKKHPLTEQEITQMKMITFEANQRFSHYIEDTFIKQLKQWTGKNQFIFLTTMEPNQYDIQTFNQLINGMMNIMIIIKTIDNYTFGVYDESIIPSPPEQGFETTKKNRKHFIFSLENQKNEPFVIERNSSFFLFQSKDFYRIYSNNEKIVIFGVENFISLTRTNGLTYKSNVFANTYNTNKHSLSDIYPNERFEIRYLSILKWI